jgi:phosphohistidine phosphatase SixA
MPTQMRPLTDKGKEQGAAARVWYDKEIGITNNKILVTSGAQRASQTLQVLW